MVSLFNELDHGQQVHSDHTQEHPRKVSGMADKEPYGGYKEYAANKMIPVAFWMRGAK